MSPRPLALLVDGVVVFPASHALGDEAAELEAAHASRHFPDAAVALVRLGSPTHTLRRFAAGQEITR